MPSIAKAFTLVELMIVIGIIAILSSMAIPVYRDYVIKAQLTDVITSVQAWKQKINDYYQAYETLPATCGTETGPLADVLNPTPYISKLRWCATTSALEATLNPSRLGQQFAGKVIQVSVKIENNLFSWQCGSSAIQAEQLACKYLPGTCQQHCSN
jgi:type IV pilus assembly protein PilA